MVAKPDGRHPALDVRGLWKIYPTEADPAGRDGAGVAALRNVSFQVGAGEIFVVMGESGSGKSTMVRCVTRLIEPTRGRVLVDGADVTAMSGAELTELRRHGVAMVFQAHGLLPHRSVAENVAFGLELRGVDRAERRERTEAMVSMVGLTGWEDAYPHELSGGMQQRVGIARALAQEPALLLMDEPFSGLDPLLRTEMQRELLALQDRLGTAVVFITHDVREAFALADRVALMRAGEIVQQGPPAELTRNPADQFVRDFTAQSDERLREEH